MRLHADYKALICLSLCWSACQLVWAVQFGFGTPTFRHLGVPNSFLGLIWIAGPLSGTIVQPAVGAASDALTGHGQCGCCVRNCGRRRPFLIVAAGLISVCLLLFANAEQAGLACGDSVNEHLVGSTLAIAAFILQDCALNAYQGPIRALVSDLITPQRHKLANSLLAFATGLSWLLGYGIGSLDLRGLFPVFKTELQAVGALAVAYVLTIGLLPLFLLAEPLPECDHPVQAASRRRKKKRYAKPDAAVPRAADQVAEDNGEIPSGDPSECLDDDRRPLRDTAEVKACCIWRYCLRPAERGCHSILDTRTSIPLSLRPVFHIQFWTFWAWFAFKMFASQWVATTIFKGRADALPGTPQEEQFNAGVRWANLCLMSMAGVFTGSSLLLPPLAGCLGLCVVWKFSLGVMAISLCSMCLPGLTAKAALVLVSLLGVPFSAAFALPWTIVCQIARDFEESRGRITSAFNLSQCLPDFVIAFLSGPLIYAGGGRSVVPVLVVGGMGAIIATVLSLCIEEPKSGPPEAAENWEEVEMADMPQCTGRSADVAVAWGLRAE